MAKVIIFVLAVLICQLCFGDDCRFFGNHINFIKKFDSFTLILPVNDYVPVRENDSIVAYCPENFLNQSTNELTIWCTKRHEYNYLECPQPSKLYKHPVVGCSHSSYIHQITINEVDIVLVEVCFDFNQFRPEFLHYIVAERKPILEVQYMYNPSWSNVSSDSVAFESGIFDIFSMNKFESHEQGEHSFLNYENSSLLPQGIFAPYFIEPKLHVFGDVLWWKPLKDSNWKLYQNLLRTRAKNGALDVYAGISHTVNPSLFQSCDYKERLKVKNAYIPLYIWNYVREIKQDNLTEVVIIGVNFPYLSLADLNEIMICEDICDRIEWLDSMKKVRRMPVLGFIFCCDVQTVRYQLRGFPKSVAPVKQPMKFLEYTPTTMTPKSFSTDHTTEDYHTESEDYQTYRYRHWDDTDVVWGRAG